MFEQLNKGTTIEMSTTSSCAVQVKSIDAKDEKRVKGFNV